MLIRIAKFVEILTSSVSKDDDDLYMMIQRFSDWCQNGNTGIEGYWAVNSNSGSTSEYRSDFGSLHKESRSSYQLTSGNDMILKIYEEINHKGRFWAYQNHIGVDNVNGVKKIESKNMNIIVTTTALSSSVSINSVTQTIHVCGSASVESLIQEVGRTRGKDGKAVIIDYEPLRYSCSFYHNHITTNQSNLSISDKEKSRTVEGRKKHAELMKLLEDVCKEIKTQDVLFEFMEVYINGNQAESVKELEDMYPLVDY